MAEIVRRRSWGGVLPLGRHVSISGSRSIHAPSVSIAPSSFQEEQNARHHKEFKREQALALQLRSGWTRNFEPVLVGRETGLRSWMRARLHGQVRVLGTSLQTKMRSQL